MILKRYTKKLRQGLDFRLFRLEPVQYVFGRKRSNNRSHDRSAMLSVIVVFEERLPVESDRKEHAAVAREDE